jgi:hypothetical protein
MAILNLIIFLIISIYCFYFVITFPLLYLNLSILLVGYINIYFKIVKFLKSKSKSKFE